MLATLAVPLGRKYERAKIIKLLCGVRARSQTTRRGVGGIVGQPVWTRINHVGTKIVKDYTYRDLVDILLLNDVIMLFLEYYQLEYGVSYIRELENNFGVFIKL